ncbi:MAG: protein-glutamate methylesterase/protein-glutamine glutaminase [Myxococcota bacterium]
MRPIRVLVVDDSAYNRRAIAEMLEELPDVEVVGKATDGDEALRMVAQLSPDLVTLDLEMPRMDGFTFLRLLMARRPTPVIVVSGYSHKENVFRALELGALDFVAKPTRTVASDLSSIRDDLAEKVEVVRHLSPANIDPKQRGMGRGRTATQIFQVGSGKPVPPAEQMPAPVAETAPLVLVGASTGGPTALVELFGRLPASARIVVAQHMPERFTKTFADRLNRISPVKVVEGEGALELVPGVAVICPGGRCVEIERSGEALFAKVLPPEPEDRYVPSVDRLFRSGARAAGEKVVAIVLTGMGDDGSRGVAEVKDAGGTVLAEAPETAVIYGMPGAAVRTGHVDRSLPLRALAERIAELVR